MVAAVRLQWKRDGADDEPKTRDAHTYIAARGGEVELYWLEGTSYRVFEDLANADCTPEDALKFVNKWGLLYPDQKTEMDLTGVAGFYSEVHYFQTMLLHARQQNYAALLSNIPRGRDLDEISGIGRFTLDVAMRPGVVLPQVFIRSRSLVSFALAELMQVIAGGAEIRTCDQCHKFFAISSDTKRRRSRKYCSDRCRVAMSRAAKAKEQEKAEATAMPKEPRIKKPTPAPAILPPRRRRPTA
jgi:hypothetical protein